MEAILLQHLSIVRAARLKHHWSSLRYLYVDAMAGCGWNDKAGCKGSPLVFLDAIRMIPIPFDAVFFERDEALCARLKSILNRMEYDHLFGDDDSIRAICEDSSLAIPELLSRFDSQSRLGLLYFDPNGIPNVDILSNISKQRGAEKLDILLRFNCTALKRNRLNGTGDLRGHMARIAKQYWIIREPLHWDAWDWTFLLGSNIPIKGWKSQRFHCVDSPNGQRILDWVNCTRPEYRQLHQMNFTDVIQNVRRVPENPTV